MRFEKALGTIGGLLLLLLVFGLAIIISIFSPVYILQSITLMGFVLTYIGIRISLTDSEAEREELLHTKFYNRAFPQMGDFQLRTTEIHVHERNSLCYKVQKYLSPRGDFDGVSEFNFEIEQGEIPPERQMWERFSNIDYLLEIRRPTEDSLMVCFASANSHQVRECLQNLMEWIDTTSISSFLETGQGEGKLCETYIEYFPARSHLFEAIYRQFYTEPKPPSTGDVTEQIGYWVHDRQNYRQELRRWPRVEIERTTLPIAPMLGPDGLHESPNHTPELFTYNEPAKVSHQLERIQNEFEGKWITVVEGSSGKNMVQMSVKVGGDERIIRKCPLEDVSFAPLDYGTLQITLDAQLIAVRNHQLNVYYPVTQGKYTNRYVVLTWDTNEDEWTYEISRIDRETLKEPWMDKQFEDGRPPKGVFSENPEDYGKIVWKRPVE